MNATTTKRTKIVLDRKEVFALTEYVKAEYTNSGLTDDDFAQHVREHYNLPKVNSNHVFGVRRDWEIPSNYHKGNGTVPLEWKASIEHRLKALEVRVETYIAGSLR